MPIVPSRAERIQELLTRLGSERAAVRESAVAQLTLLGPRAIPALLAHLLSAGARARLAALDVLERAPDERALPTLIALFGDSAPEVARRAVELAGAHPRPATLRALAGLVSGSARPELRRAAAASLARVHQGGVVEAIDPLLDVLLDEDEGEELRLTVFDLLARLDPPLRPRTLAPLLRKLKTSASAAVSAQAAGVTRGEPSAPAADTLCARLLQAARADEAARLGQALLRCGPEAVAPAHRALERAESPGAVEALASLLAQHGGTTSIPRLHAALSRLDARVAAGESPAAIAEAKARVHEALAALGSRIALYDLREMLRARPPRAATVLLAAAGRIGEASLLPVLAALATDAPARLQECAAAFTAIVGRERVRRDSRVLKAVPPSHRAALAALWASYLRTAPVMGTKRTARTRRSS
jgi:HEAT repeat protein